MKTAAFHLPGLMDRLPAVRGRISENADIGATTWFGVGGPAEILFRPADEADLVQFLEGKAADIPVTVIGVASNLLVRDGGIPGVVIRLGRGFADIAVEGGDIAVGAGALDGNVALTALGESLGGFEFLSGVPGTIGGALRMNAGAFGREMKDITVSARAIDGAGRIHELGLEDLGFSYRHCAVSEDWIFLGARLRGEKTEKSEITRRMDQIRTEREANQPTRTPTGGSTFANPDGARAWELIEAAGCRGLTRGGAKVSEKHCNFLVNTGTATAADLEGLGEDIRRRVLEETGVELRWEIRRIGVPAVKESGS